MVDADLEELGRLTAADLRELLVQHDEGLVWTLAPSEIHPAPLQCRRVPERRDLLDGVQGYVHPEDVPIERERSVHVPDADRDV